MKELLKFSSNPQAEKLDRFPQMSSGRKDSVLKFCHGWDFLCVEILAAQWEKKCMEEFSLFRGMGRQEAWRDKYTMKERTSSHTPWPPCNKLCRRRLYSIHENFTNILLFFVNFTAIVFHHTG